METFQYLAPTTTDEACRLLTEYGDDAKVIAGGQSLLLLMRQGLVRPRYLVDMTPIRDLGGIAADGAGGVTIGALTRHRDVETSATIRALCPVLVEMEHNLASVQTRNWGTIGGNLCHADPAGDPGPVLISLRAEVTLASVAGKRRIVLEEFFKDYFETALRPNEVLAEIHIPPPPPHTGTAYRKFSILADDFALASAAVSLTTDDGTRVCREARIVLGAAGAVPLRAKRAEDALRGQPIDAPRIAEVARLAAEGAEPPSDIHASAEYRRHLLQVLVARAARQALDHVAA